MRDEQGEEINKSIFVVVNDDVEIFSKKLFGELPMRKGAFGETEDNMTEAYITIFSDERLKEVIKFYEELGFEVKFPEVD